ncbi:MAG: DNA gyrase inhibitor YacG [Desulfuromonadaceae bacterium]|nr:DNA gyrase inhibitor YacG [Desulfuromonadaceae bacterium]
MSNQLTVNCPICRKKVRWENNPHRPFCSERCRLMDLGQWADEGYRIPGRTPMADELDNLIKFPGVDDPDPKE